MSRVILHADANSFYATVECLYRPEAQGRPLSVAAIRRSATALYWQATNWPRDTA